jgi:diguanylate cyclase (GGDEF)-like protein/PAS domain S-box-containing protein
VPEENGSISWLRVRGKPIYSVDGRFLGYRGSARDITAEKQRELSEKARHQALAAAAERATELTLTLSHITQGITMFDAKGCLILWNDRYVELLGLDASRLRVGMHASELVALRIEVQAFREETGSKLDSFLDRIARGETERETRTTSGGRSIETISSPVRGGGWVSTHEDITERASLMERLIASSNAEASRSRQLRLTLEHMNHGLTMFDANHRLVVWNDQFAGMFELAPEDILTGMHALEIIEMQQRNGSHAQSPADTLAAAHASFQRGEVVKSTHHRPSGRTISSQSNPIPGGGWVSLHEDVSERVRAVERINHAALHDGLTGLANRVALKQEIQLQLERRATLDDPHFSVMLIDLDRFKYVNDTFGHAVGDAVLRCVSERMKASVRTDDIVSRLGGDEFAILYRPGEHHRESSIAIATRLLQVLSSPFEVDGRQVVLGASIGIALAPEHGKDVDELMRNADAALYKVKGHTRNAFRIFDEEIEREASARRDLEADLRIAVSNMEFDLAFQPLVELSTRKVNTVETLLRWRHPVRGAVSPAIFVPILESSGLINTVGDWVIAKACEEARRLPPDVRVAVNVSPVQMRNRSLLDVVVPALLRSNLSPGRLEIEVTESVLLEDDKDLLADLHRLRELGVTIALDDFGTGYSSLSYLRMFPFDKLKIDRSFVTDLGVREDCTAIVCSVIGLAKSLNVTSVAEGIETEDQALLLRAAGCDLGQGYLFSRPVPMDDIVSRIAEGTLIPDMARLIA